MVPSPVVHRPARWMRRAPHGVLLTTLLLALVGAPFVPGRWAGFATLDLALLLAFCAAIRCCVGQRGPRAIAVALAVAAWLGRGLGELWGGGPLLAAYPVLALAFFGLAGGLIARDVFRRAGPVSGDTLCGAISLYLLIGIAWGFAFAALERFDPGSLRAASTAGPLELSRVLGFSFVTLTTLGYGNIVPGTERAGALATAEAVAGQIYLAVLVARLVGMHLTQRAADDSER